MLNATGTRVGFRYGSSDKRALNALNALGLLQVLPAVMVKLSFQITPNTERTHRAAGSELAPEMQRGNHLHPANASLDHQADKYCRKWVGKEESIPDSVVTEGAPTQQERTLARGDLSWVLEDE